MRRVLTWLVVAGVGLGAALYASFQLSPWPSVLLIRHEFDRGAIAAAEALGRHVPPGIVSTMDIRYAADDPDALLDLFKPAMLRSRFRWWPGCMAVPSSMAGATM